MNVGSIASVCFANESLNQNKIEMEKFNAPTVKFLSTDQSFFTRESGQPNAGLSSRIQKATFDGDIHSAAYQYLQDREMTAPASYEDGQAQVNSMIKDRFKTLSLRNT